MTDKIETAKQDVVPVEQPKPVKSGSTVLVFPVWKKLRNDYMLVNAADGRYFLIKNWDGQESYTEDELKKFKKPYPFAEAIKKILPSPEEMEKELYRTGVVEPEHLNLNVAKILINKILGDLEPVKLLRIVQELILK